MSLRHGGIRPPSFHLLRTSEPDTVRETIEEVAEGLPDTPALLIPLPGSTGAREPINEAVNFPRIRLAAAAGRDSEGGQELFSRFELVRQLHARTGLSLCTCGSAARRSPPPDSLGQTSKRPRKLR